mmetsp:Transcript_12773/g.19037  ORF Transcript_12773/g.19037 Transcript_12773/m.19037 type:complete len:284 (-) Transcript_12773:141-992(-)
MTWADDSEEQLEPAPAEYTGSAVPAGRPRLQLKPRSKAAAPQAAGGGSSSIFGAAKPREAVLASKGIDPTLVDKRVERKASVARLTAEQDRQVEGLRKELTEVEEKLREANEQELPEEEYRVAAEEKREELNKLMKEFAEMNLKGPSADVKVEEGADTKGGKADGRKHYERPSERRRRLEAKRREEGGEGGGYGGHKSYDNEGGDDDAYKSFGSNRNYQSGGRSGGYDSNDRGGGSYGGGERGSYRGGGRGGERGSDRDGGRDGGGRSSNNYNEKYAQDRYNY